MTGGLTDIEGIKVGVVSNNGAATGLTIVLIEEGARAAVEVRGSAPGTRETDLLVPGRLVDSVQAIMLSGGSTFGLDAASGVVRYLEEHEKGFPVGGIRVPIVPAAVIFDLFIGDCTIRPDAEMGYRACIAATAGPVPEGSVGAGTGATVAKYYGMPGAIKSGQGSAAVCSDSLTVAALVVVNAFGDIYDRNGRLLAGPRNPESGLMENTDELLKKAGDAGSDGGNTTLAAVATNASLDGPALTKVCQLAHDGFARSIWPVHTMWDGDTVFAISKGNLSADVSLVGMMAAEAVSLAIERAVQKASSLLGIPALCDLAE
ncbi:MAG: P1 family peptidase [Bacillota bacterium]|nr:P1 family peptidase [Bacillota bacterium]